MAKTEETKIVLERSYNVPLRREWLKSPKWKRSKKASKALKEFLVKHMKSDNVKVGKYLNEYLWKHGIKNPPHHVKLIAKKDSNGVVTAELEGAPVDKVVEAPKKGVEKKVAEAEKPKKEEVKAEEKKEEPNKSESKDSDNAKKASQKEDKPEEKN